MNREGTRELASERGGSGPSQGGAVLRDNMGVRIRGRVSAKSTIAGNIGGFLGPSRRRSPLTASACSPRRGTRR